jgi:hypothetical protein
MADDLSTKYRSRALECERHASVETNASLKAQWTELAIHWHFMAQQADELAENKRPPSGSGFPLSKTGPS